MHQFENRCLDIAPGLQLKNIRGMFFFGRVGGNKNVVNIIIKYITIIKILEGAKVCLGRACPIATLSCWPEMLLYNVDIPTS